MEKYKFYEVAKKLGIVLKDHMDLFHILIKSETDLDKFIKEHYTGNIAGDMYRFRHSIIKTRVFTKEEFKHQMVKSPYRALIALFVWPVPKTLLSHISMDDLDILFELVQKYPNLYHPKDIIKKINEHKVRPTV